MQYIRRRTIKQYSYNSGSKSATISLLPSFILAASVVITLLLLRGTVISLNNDYATTQTQHRQATPASSNAFNLVHPSTAAKRLQDPIWASKLRHHVSDVGSTYHFLWIKKRRRIIEWIVSSSSNESSTITNNNNNNNNGVELFLMPHEYRSSQLIDLFLHGQISDTMGENVAMMGYAKAALALGCRRVLMFESYVDFIPYVDRNLHQFYILDYMSLPALKDTLLLDPVLRRRTWDFSWWGRKAGDVQTKLNISEKYGFTVDHALIPFNYTKVTSDNVRLPVLPTAITMNHVPMSQDDTDSTRTKPIQRCHVFYMGKRVMDITNSTKLIKAVEERITAANNNNNDTTIFSLKDNVRLCTAFQIPSKSSYAQVLGFEPKYTVNVGRMKPTQFAHIVGNADVVVGSGW
eukprot:scaffold40669_cov29-Cyclotella_meneghiniana.AAC.1